MEKKSGLGLSAALDEAQSIIAAAEKRAEDLLVRAEEAYQESLQKGYADGFAEGQRECTEEGIRMIAESASIGDKLSLQAAKLALAISESVIQKSVELDPSVAVQIAKNALQQAVVGQNVVIIVHPEDAASLNEEIHDLRKIAGGAQIGIETDELIQRGGCMIRTDFGEIDSAIPTLLESIAEKLEIES